MDGSFSMGFGFFMCTPWWLYSLAALLAMAFAGTCRERTASNCEFCMLVALAPTVSTTRRTSTVVMWGFVASPV